MVVGQLCEMLIALPKRSVLPLLAKCLRRGGRPSKKSNATDERADGVVLKVAQTLKNHPVCASIVAFHFLDAQPPLLKRFARRGKSPCSALYFPQDAFIIQAGKITYSLV
jgi:hypothetical protein